MRIGGTLGHPKADRNEETGLRMNFVRCLNNRGFTENEILDIFKSCEDFEEKKSRIEITRILSEKASEEWSCKAIHKNRGCLGKKCRHYLGSVEYSDVDPNEFVILNDKGKFFNVNIPKLISKLQDTYIFLSTSAKSEIWVYNEGSGIWDNHGEEVIKQTCNVWLGLHIRSFHATEVVKQIHFGCYQPDIFTGVQTRNQNRIVMENGVYNIETGKLENFNPYLYAINRIPVKYDPDATCPAIDKFLSEVAQPKDIIKLKELIGYCLYKSYKIARIIILEGNGANGKSTYLNLINRFLGHKNVCHITVQQILEGGFKSAEMYGKLANLCGDLPSKPLKDTAMIKMLTGEDPSTHEKKFRDPFDYYNYSKQVYSTNVVPKTWDDTIAFHRRFLIIPFLNIFEEGDKNTDINLIDKLTTPDELSGLFNLSVKPLKNLLKRGKFDNEPAIAEKRELYIKKSNPIHYFAEWFVDRDLEAWISKTDLYTEYVNLCVKLEKIPVASNVFSKEVRRYLPYIMEYKKSISNSIGLYKSSNEATTNERKRIPGWKGIRVLSDKINEIGSDEKIAFQNKCDDCGNILQLEWYPHDNSRLCRRCHLKLEEQKKQEGST